MTRTGTKFTLLPKIGNLYKKQYLDPEQQAMHGSDVQEQRSKQVSPTHKILTA